jgi:hypothetical protein
MLRVLIGGKCTKAGRVRLFLLLSAVVPLAALVVLKAMAASDI